MAGHFASAERKEVPVQNSVFSEMFFKNEDEIETLSDEGKL